MKLFGLSLALPMASCLAILAVTGRADDSVTINSSSSYTSGSQGGSSSVSTTTTETSTSSSSSISISSTSVNGDVGGTSVSGSTITHFGSGSNTIVTSTTTLTVTEIMEDEYFIIMQRIIEILLFEPVVTVTDAAVQAAVDELLPAYNDLVNSLYTDDCERYVVEVKVTHWVIIGGNSRRSLRGVSGGADEVNKHDDDLLDADHEALVALSDNDIRRLKANTYIKAHITITATCHKCDSGAPLTASASARRLEGSSTGPYHNLANIPTMEQLLAEHARRLSNNANIPVASISTMNNRAVSDAAEASVAYSNGGVREAYIVALEERAQAQIDGIEAIKQELDELKDKLDAKIESYKTRYNGWYPAYFDREVQKYLEEVEKLEEEKAILGLKLRKINTELIDTRNELPNLQTTADTLKASKTAFERRTINCEASARSAAQARADALNRNKAARTEF